MDRRFRKTDDRWFSESESDKPTFVQLNRTKRRTDSAAFVDARAFSLLTRQSGTFQASLRRPSRLAAVRKHKREVIRTVQTWLGHRDIKSTVVYLKGHPIQGRSAEGQ